jgi:hypothetical protein
MNFDSGMGLFVGLVVGILLGMTIAVKNSYITCLERGHTVQECKEIVK